MSNNIEQWNLPRDAKVRLEDGTFITFKKMDGMYAQWDQNGKLAIGNFDGFRKVEGEDFYEVNPSRE